MVVLARALRPGVSLGPFDLLSQYGLTANPAVHIHSTFPADQIEQFVPWSYLAWHQVHQGQLPLWNPYNVLGTPLAFNWQSAVFSLPNMLSYLFPVHLTYTVIVMAKLLIAGTGVYVLCRVMGLRPLAAAFGGTVFELSGPIVIYAGWSIVGVMAWSGWIFAATILLIRGKQPVRATLLFAVSTAFAVYGGHPESLIILAIALVVFVALHLRMRILAGLRPIAAPLRRLVIAGVCGLGLSAPLLLPGLQTVGDSARRGGGGNSAFPFSHLTNLIAAGVQGAGYRTVSYVGVITVVLAVVGIRAAWRRPAVAAVVAVAALMGLFTFVGPFDRALGSVPGGRTVGWNRGAMVLAMALAVLAAVGLDELTRLRKGPGAAVVRTWAAGALGVAGAVVALMAIGSVTGVWKVVPGHETLLIVPAIQVVVGLAVVAVMQRPHLLARWSNGAVQAVGLRLGAVLLIMETVVLLVPGISFWSVSSGYFPQTGGTESLQYATGGGLVGFGSCTHQLTTQSPTKAEVGIRPNDNIAYGIRELAVYDPILPESYYRSLLAIGNQETPEYQAKFGIFCARITSVAEARIYGVQFVLEAPGVPGPPGSIAGVHIDGEGLYRIPGSASATLLSAPPQGMNIPLQATGEPVVVDQPDPATWRITVDTTTPVVLRLRLSAVPGWSATMDGQTLLTKSWAKKTMLETRVPAGDHVVVFHYRPTLFSDGIDVAIGTVGAIVVVVFFGAWRRRRAPR